MGRRRVVDGVRAVRVGVSMGMDVLEALDRRVEVLGLTRSAGMVRALELWLGKELKRDAVDPELAGRKPFSLY